MKLPDDALSPRTPIFQEAWHAQTLAAAHALIQAGSFTAGQWADALGAALQRADAAQAPDTEETYFLSALAALEQLAPIEQSDLESRKAEWEDAYRRTPHGQPVAL